MKKFALAAVAAAAMTAGVAQAYTVGTFSNGFVVPNVIHNGAANTTAVGIVNRTTATVPVFWTFFDQNSNHGVDGCFAMTANQYTGFNWAASSGVGMEGSAVIWGLRWVALVVLHQLRPASALTNCWPLLVRLPPKLLVTHSMWTSLAKAWPSRL